MSDSFIEVELTLTEMMHAAMVGSLRHYESIRSGRKDRHGCDGDDSLAGHINGAGGEEAAAKALGRYWAGAVGTFKGPDIGNTVQVRTRSRHDYDLLVRNDDNDDQAFIHVTGQAPRYRVHGWFYGREAKQPEWLREYDNREPAYFVPAGKLRQMMKQELAA